MEHPNFKPAFVKISEIIGDVEIEAISDLYKGKIDDTTIKVNNRFLCTIEGSQKGCFYGRNTKANTNL